jgi:hypothetical protein
LSTTRQNRLIALLLAVWFSGVGLLFYNRTGATGDIAEYVNNPVRLLYGELPYRDFWLLHPPGEVLLPAAVYALGFGVNGVLLVTAGANVLCGLAAFALARRVTGSDSDGFLAALLVFFVGVPHRYFGYASLQVDFLCLLVAAGLYVEFLRRRQRRWLFLAGAAVGVAACFKFYLAGAAGAALFVTMVCEAWQERRGAREAAKELACYAGGALLAPAVTIACLAEVWPQMWRAVLVDSIVHATSVPKFYGHKLVEFGYDALHAARHLWHHPLQPRTAWLTAPSRLLAQIALHLLPFVVVSLWLFARRKRVSADDTIGWTTCFFLLWGGFNFVRGYSSGGNTSQLTQSTTPLYFALVFLLRPLLAQARQSPTFGARLAVGTALALVVATVQAAPAETLGRLALMSKRQFPIVAPHGTLVADAADYAADMQGLIDAVLESSEHGDQVFVTAWSAPPLYALTGRRNPTYYDSLIDLCHRPSEEKERRVCQALLASDAKLVVHRRGWQFASGGLDTACPQIEACLSENFELLAEIGPHCVLRRRDVTADRGDDVRR